MLDKVTICKLPQVGVLALAIGLAGCGETVSNDPGVTDNTSRIGSQAVYDRIDSLTSCSALQREFNIAADNTDKIQAQNGDASIPESYMNEANVRMQELGCYG